MVRDPFDYEVLGVTDKPLEEVSIGGGIPKGMVLPTSVTTHSISEKQTRRRGNKIEVNGVIREVRELSKEEAADWFAARMPIYYEIIHELVTAENTPKNVKVKVLELITKVTGQIIEKHEVTVINPEDVARRGIEAAKELGEFKVKLLGDSNGQDNSDNA